MGCGSSTPKKKRPSGQKAAPEAGAYESEDDERFNQGDGSGGTKDKRSKVNPGGTGGIQDDKRSQSEFVYDLD